MNIIKRYLLSILSGFLLVLCFPFTGSVTPLVFVALIPIIITENALIEQNKNRFHFYPHAYLTFLIYNIGTTWWIWNSTEVGGILAFIFNSLLMAWAFQIYHFIHRKLGVKNGIWALLIVWTAFEWIHFNWELSWPWLSFGDVFSIRINWVQWYEYTGVLGGTIWVLVSNILGFKLVQKIIESKQLKPHLSLIGIFLSVLILPVGLSFSILKSLPDCHKEPCHEVVVVQPNIDPYDEKFDPNKTVDSQIEQMFDLANSKVSKNTSLVVCPETAISQGFIESELKAYTFYELLTSQLLK